MIAPLLLAVALTPVLAAGDFAKEVAAFRAERERSLNVDAGWLTLAGLIWLKEGENTLGSDPSCDVRLPSGSPHVGVLVRSGKSVLLAVSKFESVRVNGKEVHRAYLRRDMEGTPDRVQVRDLQFMIIERGSRIGVRLWDPHSKARLAFRGLPWFPADPALRVRARFVPYNPPRSITITNVLGDRSPAKSPGYAEFVRDGRICRLVAEGDPGGPLFFNFQDATSGRETYAAGRFLDTEAPSGGFVILDFNRATSPPCAYSDFATCPLPPKGNRLPVPIRAGEKVYRR